MNNNNRKKYFNFTELIVVIFVLLMGGVLVLFCLPSIGAPHPISSKISCASNLKQIGTAFVMYSLDNNDKMPIITAPGDTVDPVTELIKKYGKPLDKDYFVGSKLAGTSAGNFEELRLSGILIDARVYKCPSSKDSFGTKNKALSNQTSSYAYGMILGIDSTMGIPDSGIVADGVNIDSKGKFTSNHEHYGNVLYLDMHVEGFKTPKWYKNSGMWQKKVPTRKLQSTTEMF